MLERNYDKRIALGSICAGGGMATLIPPSIVSIVYAMVSGASVGELFIAGIVPGLLLASLFVAYILVRSYLNPDLVPAAPPVERNVALKQKLLLLCGLILPFFLAAAVLGSIYGVWPHPRKRPESGVWAPWWNAHSTAGFRSTA